MGRHDLMIKGGVERKMVEVMGIEPMTPCLQSRCSPTELHPHIFVPNQGR